MSLNRKIHKKQFILAKGQCSARKMNEPEPHVLAWIMDVWEARYLQSDILMGSPKHTKKYMHGYLKYNDVHKNENIKSEYQNQVTRKVFATSTVFYLLATWYSLNNYLMFYSSIKYSII